MAGTAVDEGMREWPNRLDSHRMAEQRPSVHIMPPVAPVVPPVPDEGADVVVSG
jgi:hypothetical protein